MGATDNLKTYEERIVRDKGNCGGKPVFKGNPRHLAHHVRKPG
jgi:uncharacterized protein (DUF433 family)